VGPAMSEGATSGNNGKSRRFAAFISYAHADAAIAAKLQSRLERYRLPKHIAEAHADGRAALGQIFRDREDLAAAPSLSDAIRAAITKAEALVVICSPEAKASRWVGEEIALFRQLHPDRPVLAALVRGEPEEAFPAALTEGGIEPLAADLRREGDGEALGFLKIIAGIAGVPLDALVQRDAQRRLRRVTAITAGALAAMLVMGIMTAFAIQSRNEAARQRAEAEGLVEYMLTDLREKLKGVGRLDVMGAVNERAMAYYGGTTVKGQVLKARVLHAQGDDELRQGDISAALKKLRAADAITTRLYQAHPAVPDAVFAHAQSKFWIGYAEEMRGDMPSALREKLAYSRLAYQYSRLLPGDRGAQKEVGWSHNTLGAAYLKNPDSLPEAIRHFQIYLDIFASLTSSKPDDIEARYSLMDANAWMSDAFAANNALESAVNHRVEQIKQLDILIAADRQNMEYKLRRGIALRGLARVYSQQGKNALALETVTKATEQLDASAGFDKANAEWRRQLIATIIDQAAFAQALKDAKTSAAARLAATRLLADEAKFTDRIVNHAELVDRLRQVPVI
jgi:hypothetical protein